MCGRPYAVTFGIRPIKCRTFSLDCSTLSLLFSNSACVSPRRRIGFGTADCTPQSSEESGKKIPTGALPAYDRGATVTTPARIRGEICMSAAAAFPIRALGPPQARSQKPSSFYLNKLCIAFQAATCQCSSHGRFLWRLSVPGEEALPRWAGRTGRRRLFKGRHVLV